MFEWTNTNNADNKQLILMHIVEKQLLNMRCSVCRSMHWCCRRPAGAPHPREPCMQFVQLNTDCTAHIKMFDSSNYSTVMKVTTTQTSSLGSPCRLVQGVCMTKMISRYMRDTSRNITAEIWYVKRQLSMTICKHCWKLIRARLLPKWGILLHGTFGSCMNLRDVVTASTFELRNYIWSLAWWKWALVKAFDTFRAGLCREFGYFSDGQSISASGATSEKTLNTRKVFFCKHGHVHKIQKCEFVERKTTLQAQWQKQQGVVQKGVWHIYIYNIYT